MSNPPHIVVCAGIVPDPLQTLEPTTGPTGPGIKNELVLPAVLDPWAACALYEAAALAVKNPGSKLWLVALGQQYVLWLRIADCDVSRLHIGLAGNGLRRESFAALVELFTVGMACFQ